MNNEIKRTLSEGLNGSGYRIWVVTTTRKLDDGSERILGVERFETEAEAKTWIRWA